ncbi:phage holin, lambda family [Lelliottia nimipressuralis]|uniref:Phage holin, lambda family n=1 Tax=Lelliottia nimipressuralis TaxID=69220 RepID=A0ABY3P7F5_9ENTR|nr:phage holin, lambda family [Lelliottia nimipressuralis]RXJ10442.1 phage holin, lambda family [Lelliottia nimipressuralis]TYT34989.1 phage holin, lambda family [Lelliottia nimipressuralis]
MQEPNTPGFWAVSLLWVKKNAPAIYGGLTAFGIAFFLAIRDREFWKQAFTSGILCMLIAISVISALDQLGMDKDYATLIGTFVGGLGVDRCMAIIRMFASAKTNLTFEEKDKKSDKE